MDLWSHYVVAMERDPAMPRLQICASGTALARLAVVAQALGRPAVVVQALDDAG